MSRWFRFYDDAINDPKILRLSEAMRWHWMALLCVASKNNGVLPSVADIALMLRKTVSQTNTILLGLVIAGLIDETEAGYEPHNWNGRQYKSDVSTDRVKRFRKRERNVSETSPETEQRQIAETDSEQREGERTHAKAVAPLEGKPKHLHPDWHPNETDVQAAHDEGLTDAEIDKLAKKFVANYLAKGDKRADWSAQWRSWCIEDGAKKPKAVPDEPAKDVDWDKQIGRFKRGLPWTAKWYGPEPGQLGCRAPPELLAKHGLVLEAGKPN